MKIGSLPDAVLHRNTQQPVKVKVAHVRFCHGRMLFVRAYLSKTREILFDAQDYAFAFCTHRIYDNMKTAVDSTFIGKDRLQTLSSIADSFGERVLKLLGEPKLSSKEAADIRQPTLPNNRQGLRLRTPATAKLSSPTTIQASDRAYVT
jgi:hypothetical protein